MACWFFILECARLLHPGRHRESPSSPCESPACVSITCQTPSRERRASCDSIPASSELPVSCQQPTSDVPRLRVRPCFCFPFRVFRVRCPCVRVDTFTWEWVLQRLELQSALGTTAAGRAVWTLDSGVWSLYSQCLCTPYFVLQSVADLSMLVAGGAANGHVLGSQASARRAASVGTVEVRGRHCAVCAAEQSRCEVGIRLRLPVRMADSMQPAAQGSDARRPSPALVLTYKQLAMLDSNLQRDQRLSRL